MTDEELWRKIFGDNGTPCPNCKKQHTLHKVMRYVLTGEELNLKVRHVKAYYCRACGYTVNKWRLKGYGLMEVKE